MYVDIIYVPNSQKVKSFAFTIEKRIKVERKKEIGKKNEKGFYAVARGVGRALWGNSSA